MIKFQITFLGTNGAKPAYGRFPTAQIVNMQEHIYMVDCGEGAQMRMAEYHIKWGKLEHIFISHMHGDHIFGLIGLLRSMGLNSRTQPLYLHGPAELKPFIEAQLQYSGPLSFPLHFEAVDASRHQCIYEDKVVSVYSLPLIHRAPTSGYLFKEKERPRSMIGEKINEYDIPYPKIPAIKQGSDLELPDGSIVDNKELTTAPPPPRSYAFCSDTAYNEALIPMIEGVDMLYHEATFTEEHRAQATETLHSTARQAAMIAKAARVKKLVLGHFSSRYNDLSPLLDEAQSIFPNTTLSKDGLALDIPYQNH